MDNHRLMGARLLGLVCLLATYATPAMTQSARWYQVEVLLFAQPAEAASEQWQPEPVLDYPDSFQFLIPRSDLSLQAQPTENNPAPSSAEDSATADESAPWRLPTPFALLPRSSLEFGDKTPYMRRGGGYRVLFHETWAQPVEAHSNSRSLIIDRSMEDAAWPELQGSIRLSLSRFLHVETDLWLNTNGDYLSPGWRMPAPPRAPGRALDAGTPDEHAYAAVAAEEASTNDDGEVLLADAMAADEQGYPFRHAVLLQQKRRLRSNEVHYLDHPLLGMIIKFTPLDEEQLHALALDELASR